MIKTLILGAGNRGNVYASYALVHPTRLKVLAFAEPDQEKREKFKKKYKIANQYCFKNWQDALKEKIDVDAVIIATLDQDHFEPFMVASELGYNILVEKPMSNKESECEEMAKISKYSDKVIATCHVLRYTSYFEKIKELIDSGTIGSIVGIQAIEPIGHKHFAHSYVRGNWRKKETSGPIILTKSCHDMDIFYWLVGKSPKYISSFGSLSYFKEKNAPKDSTKYCLDGCRVERECPFSAKKIYLNKYNKDWPTSTITENLSRKNIINEIKKGQFGKCVFRCDNNVCDHQTVNLCFKNGLCVDFILSAFTHGNKKDIIGKRQIQIMGTKGEIIGDFRFLEVYRFNNDKKTRIDTKKNGRDHLSRHGGGDFGLMHDFTEAIMEQNKTKISPLHESLVSHKICFRAEDSRLKEQTVIY